MRIPLAWHNLLHQKTRTAVAAAGVAFAVVLVLMQLGFLASVRQTATRIYDHLEFDLLLVSREYLHLSKAGAISRSRLAQAAAVPGVSNVAAFDVGFNLWQNADDGQRRGILVMSFDPESRVVRLPELEALQGLLTQHDVVLADRMSRHEFGPMQEGVTTEVGRRRVRVAGEFTLGTGFSADGAIVTGPAGFRRLFPIRSPGQVSLGLVRLTPGANPDEVAAALAVVLPADTRVMTRDQIGQHERRHWMTKTSVGIIFGFGVFVAALVGTAVVYQVLSSDVASRLPEFATLKAIGYTRGYLSRLVLSQALMLAVAGFVPGLLLSLALYQLTRQTAHIPIEMTWPRALGVLVLAVGMCGLSGLASTAKVHSADPADLF